MDQPTNPLVFVPAGEGPAFRVLSDTMSFKLVGEQTQEALFICFDEVPPGGGVSMHTQPDQETFLLFAGELEFRTLSEPGEFLTFTARRGDVIHVPAGVPHGYKNISGTPAEMFIVFCPAGAEKFFQRLGISAAESDGQDRQPLDPERLQQLMKQFGVQYVRPRMNP